MRSVLYLCTYSTILRNPLPRAPTSKTPVPYLVNNLREDLLATNSQPDRPAPGTSSLFNPCSPEGDAEAPFAQK